MAILEKLGIFGWKEEEENLLLAGILTGDPLLLQWPVLIPGKILDKGHDAEVAVISLVDLISTFSEMEIKHRMPICVLSVR